MTNLNCTAMNCVHNQFGMCKAGYILIESQESQTTSQTYCVNYRESTDENEAKAIENTNYISGLSEAFYSMDEVRMNPEINCHAQNCSYNLYGSCHARNVSIILDSNEAFKAKCETFIK
ncbi:DUF1540 domain-containing protein [Clostridium weizhouense]|uniref:DUF1540 domain-containing protein n=1 Tax=Clostridium weizhouense TaxID=2859781 RepID=A0ABS7ARW6_9CLOT|nr:DUF1540 domain-containing protein [Clostridium weizhouense]MBW6411422.1 DUF1540 domain-containing protein [Clostridium weizhouense]